MFPKINLDIFKYNFREYIRDEYPRIFFLKHGYSDDTHEMDDKIGFITQNPLVSYSVHLGHNSFTLNVMCRYYRGSGYIILRSYEIEDGKIKCIKKAKNHKIKDYLPTGYITYIDKMLKKYYVDKEKD